MTTLLPVTNSVCGLEYSVHRELITKHSMYLFVLRRTKQPRTLRRMPTKALERGVYDLSRIDG
jgi:hypothetical protein